MKKRIIIIDDEPLIPALIKEMMEDEAGFEISEIATSKESFLEAIKKDSFDVALIDISVGNPEGGIDILQILKNQKIPLPSIILSAHSEIDYGLKCLQAGAKGYINKGHICSDLIGGLTKVCGGGLFVAGECGVHILSQYEKLKEPSAPK